MSHSFELNVTLMKRYNLTYKLAKRPTAIKDYKATMLNAKTELPESRFNRSSFLTLPHTPPIKQFK